MRAVGNPGNIKWRFLVANYHGVNSVPGCSVGYLMGEQFCGFSPAFQPQTHSSTHSSTDPYAVCGVCINTLVRFNI